MHEHVGGIDIQCSVAVELTCEVVDAASSKTADTFLVLLSVC